MMRLPPPNRSRPYIANSLDLGAYEHHVIDTTTIDPAAAAQRTQQALTTGQLIVRSNAK